MKARFLSLLLFTAIVLASFVSAFTVDKSTIELSKNMNSATFTVDNSGSISTVAISSVGSITIGKNTIALAQTATSVPAGNITPVTISYTTLPSDLVLGIFPKEITLTNGTQNTSVTLNFNSEFCDAGCVNPATIDGKNYQLDTFIDDISVEGFGPSDTEWYPTDTITIDIKVENNGNEDISNIKVEACLYDNDKQKCILDAGDMNIPTGKFRLNNDKDKTLTGTFELNPNDIEQVGDSYTLYVKAYSTTLTEAKLSSQDSEDITVVDDSIVLLDKINVPETISCGSTIELTADAWNVGSDDLNDISLIAVNKDLGINQEIAVGDLNSLDKKDISFELQIPQNAAAKTYILKLSVYDENGDIFQTADKEKDVTYNVNLILADCQPVTPPVTSGASISATLETAQVTAGNDATIRATIKNTGTETTTYSIGVEGYEGFSTVQSVNPSTITIDAGKSQDVLITLKINNGILGEQIFTINALFDSQETKQQVSLNVAQSGFSLTGSTIGASLRANWFIWIVVLINIILIIAIIIVAARMSRA